MIIITLDDVVTIIKKIGLQTVFAELKNQLTTDFENWEGFDKSPRHAIHYPNGSIEVMPTGNKELYAFKSVIGYPNNITRNRPTVMATGQINSAHTGEPLFFSEMTLLTAIRTATVSAFAGGYLLPKSAKSMALIGCGSQSEFQALAFHFLTGISRFSFFDIDAEAMKKFARNLSKYDLELIPCQSVDEALKNADAITTMIASKAKLNILPKHLISPGMFINAIGGDCPGKTELDEAILKKARIIVEYLPQTLVEGEIQNIGTDYVSAELWEVVKGRKPGRTSEEEITVFDSVGFAIEDFSILKLFYEYAQKLTIGFDFNVTPAKDNPKDLFAACGL